MFIVIETNFSTNQPWIFKLADSSGSFCYTMDTNFYERNGLKSPITKHELDFLEVGCRIRGETTEIAKTKVLVKVYC